jgi:hypothetical protein
MDIRQAGHTEEIEMTHRMIVKTETMENGRARTYTETIRFVPTDQLDERRAFARENAPKGSTRTIKVTSEN